MLAVEFFRMSIQLLFLNVTGQRKFSRRDSDRSVLGGGFCSTCGSLFNDKCSQSVCKKNIIEEEMKKTRIMEKYEEDKSIFSCPFRPADTRIYTARA